MPPAKAAPSASVRAGAQPLLRIGDLRVLLPDGRRLFDGLDLELRAGEVVVLLGGSGSGKSTLARVLFEPKALREQGFVIEPADAVKLGDGASLGLVPQRGAPFDHLDVAGNIALALRHRVDAELDSGGGATAAGAGQDDVASWLEAVDLPRELAERGASVARLSGGQAQRLAVARTLASGRRVLFLDEPSVGLDPLRVQGLAALVRQTAAERGAAVLVVTHDLSFAEQVADRMLFVDSASGKLVPLPSPDAAAADADADAAADADTDTASSADADADADTDTVADIGTATDAHSASWRERLEAAVLERLAAATGPSGESSRAPRVSLSYLLRSMLGSLLLPAAVLVALPSVVLRQAGDALRVLGRVMRSAFLRPLPFYAVVSVLLGYTVLYVIARALPVGLRAGKAVELVGGSYILALAPPVCAFLFVATSGSATSAWLGSMGLTRQIAALEALGIDRKRYLWVPGYVGLALSFLGSAAVFGAGMALGGYWHCWQSGVPNPWPLLLGDLLDPEPARAVLRARALWLVGIYAFGAAAEVVHRGTLRKESADDVTRAMTGSVVIATLWVVGLELITAMWVFSR